MDPLNQEILTKYGNDIVLASISVANALLKEQIIDKIELYKKLLERLDIDSIIAQNLINKKSHPYGWFFTPILP